MKNLISVHLIILCQEWSEIKACITSVYSLNALSCVCHPKILQWNYFCCHAVLIVQGEICQWFKQKKDFAGREIMVEIKVVSSQS